uniref:Uncharacterized protein n=1 Tax=Oryza punctata TaxID=4537 RepID=A0A0E0K6E1_ORYPU
MAATRRGEVDDPHEAHWRNLEGRGWKSPRRRRRPDGLLLLLIIRSRCARTDRPFALAAAAALASPLPDATPPDDDDEGDDDGGEEESRARGLGRWRMQRKEPGWLVGEQRQASLGLELDASLLAAMSPESLSRPAGRCVDRRGARRRWLPGVSGPVVLYARNGGFGSLPSRGFFPSYGSGGGEGGSASA